jgi:hypothetical protein
MGYFANKIICDQICIVGDVNYEMRNDTEIIIINFEQR